MAPGGLRRASKARAEVAAANSAWPTLTFCIPSAGGGWRGHVRMRVGHPLATRQLMQQRNREAAQSSKRGRRYEEQLPRAGLKCMSAWDSRFPAALRPLRHCHHCHRCCCCCRRRQALPGMGPLPAPAAANPRCILIKVALRCSACHRSADIACVGTHPSLPCPKLVLGRWLGSWSAAPRKPPPPSPAHTHTTLQRFC